MSKSFREKIPEVAVFIDAMRNAFGADLIDGQMRKGMRGEPTFYAYGNGYEVGTRDTSATSVIKWDERGLSYSVEPDWMTDARRYAIERGITIRSADRTNAHDIEREINDLRKIIAMGKP